MVLFVLVAVVVLVVLIVGGAFVGGAADATPVGIIVGFSLWVVLTGAFAYMAYGTEETVRITVERTERIADGDGGKWMVYAAPAESGETFKNTDALFHGKTDSTDVQRSLVAGRTCTTARSTASASASPLHTGTS